MRADVKAKGPPDRRALEELAASGATLREMAEAVDRSVSTVRYWLDRWKIRRSKLARKADPATSPRTRELHCRHHGSTRFVLEGRGYYRCMRCRAEAVSEWRRRTKLALVAEAGGCCALCGYDGCVAALQFHHRDPSLKRFALSREGVTRSRSDARAEAAKCVLLCANCHAEVEAGYSALPDTARAAA